MFAWQRNQRHFPGSPFKFFSLWAEAARYYQEMSRLNSCRLCSSGSELWKLGWVPWHGVQDSFCSCIRKKTCKNSKWSSSQENFLRIELLDDNIITWQQTTRSCSTPLGIINHVQIKLRTCYCHSASLAGLQPRMPWICIGYALFHRS